MFILTEKGEEELGKYKGATEEDLRLTRRTLMIPVMEAIVEGRGTSFDELLSTTGFSRYEMTGILRTLYRLGFIERQEPTGDATKEEERSWYMYLLGQRRGKKPESRTKEQLVEATARSMERYPEVTEAAFDAWTAGAQKKWMDRHGGSKAYREKLKERGSGT